LLTTWLRAVGEGIGKGLLLRRTSLGLNRVIFSSGNREISWKGREVGINCELLSNIDRVDRSYIEANRKYGLKKPVAKKKKKKKKKLNYKSFRLIPSRKRSRNQ